MKLVAYLACKSCFDFETNVTLKLEEIIRATFLNPDRRKFEMSKCFRTETHSIYPDTIDPETLIKRISTEIPKALQKFNQQNIRLHDTSRLESTINKDEWLADLKKLKWYGPFKGSEDVYKFQTATDSGNFEGLHLEIFLNT